MPQVEDSWPMILCVCLFYVSGCPYHHAGDTIREAPICAGFRVGKQLIERYTINKPLFGSDLDVIKFICKEFWNDLFRKQVSLFPNKHSSLPWPILLSEVDETCAKPHNLSIWDSEECRTLC